MKRRIVADEFNPVLPSKVYRVDCFGAREVIGLIDRDNIESSFCAEDDCFWANASDLLHLAKLVKEHDKRTYKENKGKQKKKGGISGI